MAQGPLPVSDPGCNEASPQGPGCCLFFPNHLQDGKMSLHPWGSQHFVLDLLAQTVGNFFISNLNLCCCCWLLHTLLLSQGGASLRIPGTLLPTHQPQTSPPMEAPSLIGTLTPHLISFTSKPWFTLGPLPQAPISTLARLRWTEISLKLSVKANRFFPCFVSGYLSKQQKNN